MEKVDEEREDIQMMLDTKSDHKWPLAGRCKETAVKGHLFLQKFPIDMGLFLLYNYYKKRSLKW